MLDRGKGIALCGDGHMRHRAFWWFAAGAFLIGLVNMVGGFVLAIASGGSSVHQFGQFGGLWCALGLLAAWVGSALRSLEVRRSQTEGQTPEQEAGGRV